jgi:hypothetical protein
LSITNLDTLAGTNFGLFRQKNPGELGLRSAFWAHWDGKLRVGLGLCDIDM